MGKQTSTLCKQKWKTKGRNFCPSEKRLCFSVYLEGEMVQAKRKYSHFPLRQHWYSVCSSYAHCNKTWSNCLITCIQRCKWRRKCIRNCVRAILHLIIYKIKMFWLQRKIYNVGRWGIIMIQRKLITIDLQNIVTHWVGENLRLVIFFHFSQSTVGHYSVA